MLSIQQLLPARDRQIDRGDKQGRNGLSIESEYGERNDYMIDKLPGVENTNGSELEAGPSLT